MNAVANANLVGITGIARRPSTRASRLLKYRLNPLIIPQNANERLCNSLIVRRPFAAFRPL